MGLFGNKPIKSVGVGEWDFDFYFSENDLNKSYLEVKSTDGQFQIRIPANSHTYGYLLEAANQELYEQLHGWIAMVYAVSMLTTTDQGFSDGIHKEIIKWHKRMLKKAEKEAKATTEEQLQADEAFMQSVVEESTMSADELKERRKEEKEVLKQILKEQD